MGVSRPLLLRGRLLLTRSPRPATICVMVAVALAACGRESGSTAVFNARPGATNQADGVHPTRTELRIGDKRARVGVTWERVLDASARDARDPVVFVMFFPPGAERPSAMVIASAGNPHRTSRCTSTQLGPSGPWVLGAKAPVVTCPEFPAATVDVTSTGVSVSWPRSALDLPGRVEWAARVVSNPPGGGPVEEFLPGQPQPVTTWPKVRATGH